MLSLILDCIQIATQLRNHSVLARVRTSGPLPQVRSVCQTAAPEGEEEAAPNARSSAGSHGMQGSSKTSTAWDPSLPHIRNRVRTGQTDAQQASNFSSYFHI